MRRVKHPARFFFTWRGFFVLVAVVFVTAALVTFVLQQLGPPAP